MTTNTVTRNSREDLFCNSNLGLNSPYFEKLPSNINIFNTINSIEFQSQNEEVNKVALTFLNCFKEMLVSIYENHKFSNNLPPLAINLQEDSSILIEWIFPDFRIGFSIEQDLSASNWYLIANSKFKEKISSETFNPLDPYELLRGLIIFALRNS